MNKKQQILILLLLLTIQVFSQTKTVTLKPINFGDCDMNGMFIEMEKAPQWNSDSISLVQYMNKNVKDSMMVKVKRGKILLGILIFTNGKTCCSSFTNLTNCELNPTAYKNTINSMPNWLPGQQNGQNVKCLKTLILNIQDGKFVEKISTSANTTQTTPAYGRRGLALR